MKHLILFISISFMIAPAIFAAATIEDCSFSTTANPEVFLQGCSKDSVGIKPYLAGDTKASIKERIKLVATGVISLGALFAVGALVWAGIQYTKAYGEDESLKKAKTTGIYALIGLFLLMASFGLVNIFVNFVYTVAGK